LITLDDQLSHSTGRSDGGNADPRTLDYEYISSQPAGAPSNVPHVSGHLQPDSLSPCVTSPSHTPPPNTRKTQHRPGLISIPHNSCYADLLLQPDSRPVSQQQLAAEIKSVYEGLTTVETKCIDIDKAQSAVLRGEHSHLADSHWQALIALHRVLLHEHHDFFPASQHPSASPAFRELPAKYSMPARMWKHGIHSFLECLRHRLPESSEYMLAFFYLAYQMMGLLYETVPSFENT